MMIRFPIDCPNDCPHLTSWDLSVDDWTYACDLLNQQIDGCDMVMMPLPFCPIGQEVIGECKRITSEFTRLTYTAKKASDAIVDILRRMAQEGRDADKFARYYVRKYKPNNWLKMHGFPKRRNRG